MSPSVYLLHLAVTHLAQYFEHDLANEFVGDLHGWFPHYPRAEKMVRFSTLTVSTMPTMVASTGSLSVSGVSRALDPCTISTISPCPAPTVSTTTNVRPVETRRSRW